MTPADHPGRAATLAVLAAIRAAEPRPGSRGRVRAAGAVLQGADLRGAHLQGADLRWAHIQGADIQGAHLQGANIQGANIQGADLQDADLQGADLQDADLQDADLRGAHLQGANLRWAHIRDADLQGADLQDADLQGADLQDADLHDADLSGTVLDPAAPLPPASAAALLAAGLEPDPDGERAWGWRTARSMHCGSTEYTPRPEPYEAPWFSSDATADCHPGIYLAGRRWLEMDPDYEGEPLVRCYCIRAELLHAGNKWRCKRLWVTEPTAGPGRAGEAKEDQQ